VAVELFTGKNPLKPGGPNKSIKLDPVVDLHGPIGETIKARLEELLVIETDSRPSAYDLLPLWLDLYRTMVRRQDSRRHDPVISSRGNVVLPRPSFDPARSDEFGAGIFE
jgi:hypothetical protein